MIKSKIGRRVAIAGTIGAASLMAAMGAGAGIAGALPTDPSGGSVPTAPSFNNGIVNQIRGTGSDTTIFMMQQISDLYTGAGLYGCTTNIGSEPLLYNSLLTSAPGNANFYCKKGGNTTTTDTADNWNRTEVAQGVDLVGSGAGQDQICGRTPTPLPVDFTRSSKPKGSGCADLQQLGYAKDSVPVTEFQINPSAAFGAVTTAGVYSTVNGGNVGNVTLGWLPGDPTAGPYTGTPYTNVSNADNTGGAKSTAYRLWCSPTPGNTSTSRISDWGQLTNLGPNMQVPNVTLSGTTTATATFPDGAFAPSLSAAIVAGDAVTDLTTPGNIAPGTTVASVSGTTITLSAPSVGAATNDTLSVATGAAQPVGSGSPIGLQVRILGVNTGSGTAATWASFAESGVSGGGCASNTNTNAASGPNPATAVGDNAGPHVALENNVSQTTDFGAADWPGDNAAQAVEAATTLYFISNGVYSSNPYAASGAIGGTQFSTAKTSINGLAPTTTRVLNNTFATSRTLFNIYRTSTVRASTAGFLNWICDSQSAITKQVDHSSGLTFDAELGNIIGSFGFIRLSDSSNVASFGNTPADNVSGGGINTSCASGLNGTATAGNGIPAITAVANPQT